MTRLWQRNLVGAAVSVVALAVIVVTSLWPNWTVYRESTHADHVVPAGEAGTAAGQTWEVASVSYRNTSANRFIPDLPDGTLVHVITIDSSGSGLPGCNGVITDGRRRWSAEVSSGYGPTPPVGTNAYCGKPGPVQFSFLLPDDVSPTAVDVTDWQGRILVRLQL